MSCSVPGTVLKCHRYSSKENKHFYYHHKACFLMMKIDIEQVNISVIDRCLKRSILPYRSIKKGGSSPAWSSLQGTTVKLNFAVVS